jgi:hypothetical protein
MKTRSFLKMGLKIVTFVGLILIVVAAVRSLETSKIPETKNKMVSFRIIDVPYKGQILKKRAAKDLKIILQKLRKRMILYRCRS